MFHSDPGDATFSLLAYGGVGGINRLQVKAFNEAVAPNDMSGAVEATIDDGVFCVPDLRVTGLDPMGGNVMSVRAWDMENPTDTFAANNLPVSFTDLVVVDAQHCIWFHYANSELTGPIVLENSVDINDPKENAWNFRPPVIPVPPAATSVTLTCVSNSVTWHNINEANAYYANGINPERQVSVRTEYLDEFNFPSESHHSNTVNLGKLVAVLIGEDGGGNDIAGPVLEIGNGSSSPPDLMIGGFPATKILLGFHDKQEWYDNGGSQTVRVVFS